MAGSPYRHLAPRISHFGNLFQNDYMNSALA